MKTYIIAEAGVNHNGSVVQALRLVDQAVAAGADAIKFQTFRAEEIVTRTAPKAGYQARLTSDNESQYEMLRQLELNYEEHKQLLKYSREKGIEFLSTPFDGKSVDFLVGTLGLRRLKIASGEITNGPLLLQAARSGADIILSTGMSTLAEIETALGVLAFGYVEGKRAPSLRAFEEAYHSEQGRRALRSKVMLLHCTSEYPAPVEEVNLRAMDVLRTAFGLPVGLSDHTEGISVAVAAVARGAVAVEKHFTLDRNLPGPDHKASLEPDELGKLVRSIRQVEKALGIPWKGPTPSELPNRVIARRSLVAKTAIRKGQLFTIDNLTWKRPGTGVSPNHFWDWLGRPARRDYAPDEVIDG